ncbi:MAG TPA: S8 family serine peptidase [Stenomitos sp.]
MPDPVPIAPQQLTVPIGLKAGVKASDGQLIVGLRPDHSLSELPTFNGKPVTLLGELDFSIKLQMLRLPEGVAVDDAIAALQDHPAVSLIAPNRNLTHAPAPSAVSYSWRGTTNPNDPYFPSEWAFSDSVTNARALWQRSINAGSVMVAVIDTGVDYTHPELRGRVLAGYNFKDGTSEIMDQDGHGTHVAGLIAAAGNNGQGIAGVSWTAKILAIKVMDSVSGTDYGAIAGIKYAVDAGAKVLNLSFSSDNTQRNPLFDLAVQYALDHGALVVAAAGNKGGPVSAPGNSPGALTVSATSDKGMEKLASFSNFGPEVYLAAPGDNILSTVPGGGYKAMSGTSMATPIVSGAAAVLFAEHPDWTVDQVKSALAKAVDPLGTTGRTNQYGYGRIDLGKLP